METEYTNWPVPQLRAEVDRRRLFYGFSPRWSEAEQRRLFLKILEDDDKYCRADSSGEPV